MRILVISTFYPPVAFGGYERECEAVVQRLRGRHEVRVLTSDRAAGEGSAPERHVQRTLPLLTPDARGALRAPFAALPAVRQARRALEWRPELVYVWNGSELPHALLRVLADRGAPIAVRVCEHWFGRLFTGDQYLRELLPADRRAGRRAWSAACRVWNRQPSLRLRPTAPVRLAISWNSSAIARMVAVPAFVEPVLQRITHSVPLAPEAFAAVRRTEPSHEVVFIGRVSPEKGIAVAIAALAIVRASAVPDATLTVIGPVSGDHDAELRAVAACHGVADQVRLLGPQPPATAAAALAGAGALIAPSVWDEPFPLVTLEAALARVPVVAADVGGIAEGLHDEEHALLFPRADAEGAARCLARVLTERAATEQRVVRAARRAAEFGLGAYLDAQERFVEDARSALAGGGR